jgi:hypothetical protein
MSSTSPEDSLAFKFADNPAMADLYPGLDEAFARADAWKAAGTEEQMDRSERLERAMRPKNPRSILGRLGLAWLTVRRPEELPPPVID